MPKVISAHIKIEVPIHHEIIVECKLEVLSFHILSAWIKHQMAVDINIQGPSYAKNSANMRRISNAFKIQLFPVENIFFPIIYLINSSIRGNGITHSLYVKFEIIHRFKIGIF